jgi:hypothetical protein
VGLCDGIESPRGAFDCAGPVLSQSFHVDSTSLHDLGAIGTGTDSYP